VVEKFLFFGETYGFPLQDKKGIGFPQTFVTFIRLQVLITQEELIFKIAGFPQTFVTFIRLQVLITQEELIFKIAGIRRLRHKTVNIYVPEHFSFS